MTRSFVFKKEFIQTDFLKPQKEAVISQLAIPLLRERIVLDSFLPHVLNREEKHPTGIPAKTIGIAIPHTDSEHVRSNGLAVGILRDKPITFQVMGAPQQDVEVRIVFLLAMKDVSNHLRILQNIMSLVQDNELVEVVMNEARETIFQFIATNILSHKE